MSDEEGKVNMDLDTRIDSYKDEIILQIQNLVRIKSVEGPAEEGKPFGKGPAEALSYLLKAGEKLGFSTKNLDGYAGHIEYGGGEEIVGALVHVDVVPEGDGWTRPPYSAALEDGKIYGRGSYDDKGACIAVLYALKVLKDAGFQPKKTIRIIIGANEETGMKCIPHYLSREPEPDIAFSPDAPFPVVYGEKGILELSFKMKWKKRKTEDGCLISMDGGKAAKMVPAHCTADFQLDSADKDRVIELLKGLQGDFGTSCRYDEDTKVLSVTLLGKEAYGTEPHKGKNAVAGMMSFLGKVDCIDAAFRSFVNEYNRTIGESWDGAGLGCDFEDDISTPLTFNVGTVHYDSEGFEMKAHIRYPIRTKYEEILGAIRSNFHCRGVSIETDRLSESHLVGKDSFLVETLMDIYRRATGDAEAEPITMVGGTYARTLTNAVAFGPLFPGEKQLAHSPDEYLNIASIIKAAKIYAEALYTLSR